MYRVPNISVTRPMVSGTVDSHSSPMAAVNRIVEAVETGTSRNATITAERAK